MADFSLTRGAHIAAEPARIHALVDDFREWRKWSPWEGLDADLRREYSGPDHGAGFTYRWSGNRRAGCGTDVTWTMTGHRSAVMSGAGKLFFDKAIGKDFDRGLASLKREAERG